MDDIVSDAMDNAKAEKEKREQLKDSTGGFGTPEIAVVGCGGAGNNTVNRLYNIGIEGATTIALNTDKQHLKMVEADEKVLVGGNTTKGLGAGGDPNEGRKATENARPTLIELLEDMDLVFITAGMGGGTGTGAAPVVADVASDEGSIVVSMVSTPFDVEGSRKQTAKDGLERLQKQADSIIVLDNNRLLDYVPDLPMDQAFSVMDQIISETVKGITETITQPSLINLDYADMRSIMRDGGVAVMLVGETKDQDKVNEAVREAMNHPLLDVDYRGATGGLVHITGGENMTLKQAEGIADGITNNLDDRAELIWGARVEESYEGKVRVMAIMTNVSKSADLISSTALAEDDTETNTTSTQSSSSSKIDQIN